MYSIRLRTARSRQPGIFLAGRFVLQSIGMEGTDAAEVKGWPADLDGVVVGRAAITDYEAELRGMVPTKCQH